MLTTEYNGKILFNSVFSSMYYTFIIPYIYFANITKLQNYNYKITKI